MHRFGVCLLGAWKRCEAKLDCISKRASKMFDGVIRIALPCRALPICFIVVGACRPRAPTCCCARLLLRRACCREHRTQHFLVLASKIFKRQIIFDTIKWQFGSATDTQTHRQTCLYTQTSVLSETLALCSHPHPFFEKAPSGGSRRGAFQGRLFPLVPTAIGSVLVRVRVPSKVGTNSKATPGCIKKARER
jgi:hypothetical protein